MKRTSIFVLSLICLVFSTQITQAKLLPQAKKAGPPVRRFSGSNITVYPRLNRAKNSITISFGNLGVANSVNYSLIYTTNGHEEGAGGSVNPKERSATREVLFGTCSANVCRLHSGITNARLEITTQLKSGKQTIKRFRIKL